MQQNYNKEKREKSNTFFNSFLLRKKGKMLKELNDKKNLERANSSKAGLG